MMSRKYEMEYTDRDVYVKQAIDAIILLDNQLNVLLDAYDFFTQRYDNSDESDKFQLRDLEVSIHAIAELPKLVTLQLNDWKHGRDPQLSRLGFEQNVLNEFNLHFFSIAMFMSRKGIELENLNPRVVGEAFNALRHTARHIPASTQA